MNSSICIATSIRRGIQGRDAAMFFFPVDVPERRPQLHLPLPAERVYQGKTDGILLRDGRLPAFARQVHHEPFPSFHRHRLPARPAGRSRQGWFHRAARCVCSVHSRAPYAATEGPSRHRVHFARRCTGAGICKGCSSRIGKRIRVIIQVGIIRHTASLFRRAGSPSPFHSTGSWSCAS